MLQFLSKNIFLIFILISLNANYTFSQDFIKQKDSLNRLLDTLTFDTNQVNIHLKLSDKNINKDINKRLYHVNFAKTISKNIHYETGTANSLIIMSLIELESGLNKDAGQNLMNALRIFRKNQDYKNEAKTLKIISEFYNQILDFNNSLSYLKKYYSVSKKHDLIKNQSEALVNMGYIFLRLNNPDSAIFFSKKSLEISNKLNQKYAIVRTRVIIANAYYDKNEFSKAYEYINTVKPEEINITINQNAIINFLYALIHFKLENKTKADNFYSKARNIQYDTNDYRTIDDLYLIKYKADSTFNNSFDALESYQKYTDIKLSKEKDEFSVKSANFQVMYDIEEKQNKIQKLRKKNQIIVLNRKRSFIFIIAIIISIFLLTIFLLIILRSLKIKSESNKQFHSINQELESQKDNLINLNIEISSQREELFVKSKKLHDSLEKLKFTQTKLIHVDNMASIGTMTKGIAHEINNPLNFISGGVMILEDLNEKEIKNKIKNLNEAIRIIKEGVVDAGIKVKTLLNYSYDGNSDPVDSDINQLIDNSIKLLEFEIPETSAIIKEYTDIPKVRCFQDKMLQVFINVLKNAFDAVKGEEKNKKVIIKTEYIQNNKIVKISIFNTGEKIPEHLKNNVFDPFLTSKKSIKRSGLGLTTAFNIIKEHKGKIQLFNKDKGVVCEISLKKNFEES